MPDVQVVLVGTPGPAGSGLGTHEALANAVGHVRVVTSGTRPSPTASDEGVVIYEEDTNLFYVWDGSAWKELFLWINKFRGVQVNRTTNQSIPDAVDTVISFTDADTYDTDAFHDTATNPSRITIPAGLGGYYAGVASFTLPGSSVIKIYWRLNGTTPLIVFQGSEGANTNIRQCALAPVNLVAGDYLEVLVYQDTAGAQNVTGHAKLWRIGT